MNKIFKEWLALYHKRIQSGLGISPLQKLLGGQNACRPLPEPVNTEPLFRMKRRCRVYLNNTIRFKKRSYELADAMPGERVDIWFIPWDTRHRLVRF